MNDELRSNGMAEALRLTRAGRLTEAFAVLQRSLDAACPTGPVGTAPEIAARLATALVWISSRECCFRRGLVAATARRQEHDRGK